MKKTAVLMYDSCCLFEMAVALEMLKMAGKPVEYVAKIVKPIKTEEGMLILADKGIRNTVVDEYDSLLIPGAEDARAAIEDAEILAFVEMLSKKTALIGAISIAPVFLLKTGVLRGKPFMVGCEKEDLYEEGFTRADLAQMVGWGDAVEGAVPALYMQTDRIITSVAFGFRQWAMAIGNAMGLETYPKSFGL